MMNLPPALSNLGLNVALNQLPKIGLTSIKSFLATLQKMLPSLQSFLINLIQNFVPNTIPNYLADEN